MASATIHPKDQPVILGHPVGLFVLFFTEMWERFSYYGMRGLLKLYMVYYLFVGSRQILQGGTATAAGDPSQVLGWHFIHDLINSAPGTAVGTYASVIYGWYTGLVYLTPVLGGYLADKYWGQRKTVYLGGFLMALGHFTMAFENWFFIALLLLIIGNGAFKPNISTQVGNLYPEGDPRRDGAFTIFYMGINLGAFICNLVCGTLAATMGWHYGFGAAGIGMCIGLITYYFGQKYLAPDTITVMRDEAKLKQASAKSASSGGSAASAIAGSGAATASASSSDEKKPLDKGEWNRVWALVGLCLLNVVFWAVYEQQGNTMQSWAEDQTVWPVVFGFQIPSTWFQSFNPLFIFMFAPLLDIFWMKQAKNKSEPSSVTKMAIGSIILGLSFLIMVAGAQIIGAEKGSWLWPVVCVLFVTIGELYLSPIGLSLVTKVAPARIVSVMMGIWLTSSFVGNILSGYIGVLYEQKILTATNFFWLLTFLGIVTGLAMFAFSKPLKKAMGSHAA